MKFWKIAFVISMMVWSACASALDLPKDPMFVNDFAKRMSPAERQQISLELGRFQETGKVSIVVVTVPSLAGYATEHDMAVAIFDKWAIGNKERNSGILMLIIGDKEPYRVRITPGYGIEGPVADLQARDAADATVSLLNGGHFAEGVTVGVHAIMKMTGHEFDGYEKKTEDSFRFWLIGFLVFFVLLIAFTPGFLRRQKRREENERLRLAQAGAHESSHIRGYGGQESSSRYVSFPPSDTNT